MDTITHDAPSPDDGVSVAVEPADESKPWSAADGRQESVDRNRFPLWAESDIDLWCAHLQNSSEEEAKGSHEDFNLIAWTGKVIVFSAHEVDLLCTLRHTDGLTLIDCYGDEGLTRYVGIMEGHHEVYTSHKE
jgi:hypothetical protein